MQRRQELADSRLEQIFSEHDGALDHGVVEPVVFLIDCEDEIGSEIARQWAGDEAVDRALAEHRWSVTTLASAVSFAECREEVPQLFPYLADSFDHPPEEGFLAIVIASGGAASFVVPFDAQEAFDDQ